MWVQSEYPVVQIRFKLHILNRREKIRGQDRGRKRTFWNRGAIQDNISRFLFFLNKVFLRCQCKPALPYIREMDKLRAPCFFFVFLTLLQAIVSIRQQPVQKQRYRLHNNAWSKPRTWVVIAKKEMLGGSSAIVIDKSLAMREEKHNGHFVPSKKLYVPFKNSQKPPPSLICDQRLRRLE